MYLFYIFIITFFLVSYVFSFYDSNTNNFKNSFSNSKEASNYLDNMSYKMDRNGLNKFLFIEINQKNVHLEYFQYLLQELLLSNGEHSRSYIDNKNKLIIVLPKESTLSLKHLKSIFKDYIINAYFK